VDGPVLGGCRLKLRPRFFIPFNLDINSVAVKGSDDFAGLQGTLAFTDASFSGTLH
jgi:hypothetical protein